METRKLIKFGNSSHIISVPKSWVKENKLKKGDLIYLKKNSNGELILLPKEKNDAVFKKAVIHATSKDMKLIQREILAAYIKGFNILSVTSPDIKSKMSEIKGMLKDLAGVDILEKNSTEIVAADFLDIKSVSIRDTIRRIDNNLKSMFEDLKFIFEKGKIDEKEFNEIYDTDNDVNRFYFLLWKLTVLGLSNPTFLHEINLTPVELTHTWWLGMNMERIGDELKRASRDLRKTKLRKAIARKIYSIFTMVRKNYMDVIGSYYKRNIGLAYEITSKRRDIIDKCNSISVDDPNVAKICEKLKSIQSYIHNMAKCTIYFT